MDRIALRYIRGETLESVHRASVAVADSKGRRVAQFGDPRLVTFLRSSAKPLQLVPLIESGAADRFGFTEAELAIMAGSHSGEEEHVATVQGILDRAGIAPEALRCGRHAPFDAAAAERVGSAYTTLHHNCSGKHAAMLALCKDQGWDPDSYLQPGHPLQQAIRRVIGQECGLPDSSLETATDGCGVVTFAVPLARAARSYARLAEPSLVAGKRGVALRRVRDAMMKHPRLVAGTHRIDTDLMQLKPGTIVVKGGAEACYALGLPGKGWGLAAKIEDGNPRGMPMLLVTALEQLGFLDARDLRALERHWNEPIRNVAGNPVGRVECSMRLRLAAPRRVTTVAR